MHPPRTHPKPIGDLDRAIHVGLFCRWSRLVDALPDLSDVQVILRTTYPGQAPDLVETQVTYPLTTTMLSVPGARTVRGYSFFGDSFVYVLFEDGTDPYWARSRVLEALAQVQVTHAATGTRPGLGMGAGHDGHTCHKPIPV